MQHLAPYIRLMRLDKPIGIWLVLFPALWGVLIAQPHPPNLALLLAMLVGAVLMRSAGCIINDLTDADLDQAVTRTKTRPLASGEISKKHALICLSILLFFALMLTFFLPRMVLLLGMMALPFIALYPWMKRFTWWPQLFLGFTFNFGALIGWAATGASITTAAYILYLACVAWTLGYDTIYAMQDAADDAIIGIRSTARLFAGKIYELVNVCYSFMVCALMLAASMASMRFICLIGLLGVTAHAFWQTRQLKKPDATSRAASLFRSNQWLGVWLFFCILLDRCLLTTPTP